MINYWESINFCTNFIWINLNMKLLMWNIIRVLYILYSCSLMSWLVPGLISLFIIESGADFLCLVQLIRDWCCLLISAQNMAEIQLQRRFSLIPASLTELAAPILFAAASTPGSGGHTGTKSHHLALKHLLITLHMQWLPQDNDDKSSPY